MRGMAAGRIANSGGDTARAVAGIDALLAKVPAVSGSGAQQTPGLDNDAVRLLDQAEQVAAKAGGEFVAVQNILLAMVLGSGTPVGKARSEEHTSELKSLMRISYAAFCLKKQNKN